MLNNKKDEMRWNRHYNLPFRGVGDTYRGKDYRATQATEDTYEVHVDYPWGLSSSNMVHMVDPQTMHAIINGHNLPHLGLNRMSDEEKAELSELEKELDRWKKTQELNKFKQLPAHIRQEIVDEAIINDLMNSNEPESNFPDIERLKELRSKDYRIRGVSVKGFDPFNAQDNMMVLKYGPILRKYTTDELIEAHTEATLEDQIAN